MTLDQLRIFLAVADLRHVTRAAERLNLTQSAVSSAIATLERVHDVQLFDRVGRGIVPTEAALALMPAARRLLAEAEATRLLLQDFSRHTLGRLRLYASQTVANYWLPPFLTEMHEVHPRVALSLHAGNSTEVAQAVRDGAADLGFVEGDTHEDDLTQATVARDELVLVMARTHPLVRQPYLTPEDYPAFRWLMREEGSGTREIFEHHLEQAGQRLDGLDVLLDLPSNEAILSALRASRAVSMLSWRSITAARDRGLAVRRIAGPLRPRRTFSVLTHPKRQQTRAARAFLDLIASQRRP